MVIEMPGFDADKVGGYEKLVDGQFHVEIVGVDEDGGHNGAMVVEMEVLRGTVKGFEGFTHKETFFKDFSANSREKTLRKFAAFGIACGIATADDYKAGKPVDYTLAVGKQIVADIREYNNYMNVYFDSMWHPADRRAIRCPLNEAKIKAAKIELPPNRNPDGVNAHSGNGKQSTPKAEAKPAASVNDMDL